MADVGTDVVVLWNTGAWTLQVQHDCHNEAGCLSGSTCQLSPVGKVILEQALANGALLEKSSWHCQVTKNDCGVEFGEVAIKTAEIH